MAFGILNDPELDFHENDLHIIGACFACIFLISNSDLWGHELSTNTRAGVTVGAHGAHFFLASYIDKATRQTSQPLRSDIRSPPDLESRFELSHLNQEYSYKGYSESAMPRMWTIISEKDNSILQ